MVITVLVALSDAEKVHKNEVNQSKIDGTKKAFERFFPEDEIVVITSDVPGKHQPYFVFGELPESPQTENETFESARAQNSYLDDCVYYENLKPNYLVSLQTGVSFEEEDVRCFTYSSMATSSGNQSSGRSSTFAVPLRIQQEMKRGHSFEGALTEVYPRHMYPEADNGLIAVLSKGVLTRTDQVASAVTMALVEQVGRYLYQPYI